MTKRSPTPLPAVFFLFCQMCEPRWDTGSGPPDTSYGSLWSHLKTPTVLVKQRWTWRENPQYKTRQSGSELVTLQQLNLQQRVFTLSTNPSLQKKTKDEWMNTAFPRWESDTNQIRKELGNHHLPVLDLFWFQTTGPQMFSCSALQI